MSNNFTPTARPRLTPAALTAALAELSAKLTETSASVQAFYESGLEAAQASPNDPDYENQPGETRHYYFSPLTLRHERALLELYEVQDWRELLSEAHLSISGVADLMKNLEQGASIEASTVFSLGCLLERQAEMLFRIQDAYSGLELMDRELVEE